MRATEAFIIGAGPYGLSISTHLTGRKIDHVIVGRPMDTWRSHMPTGMYLKSEPYGSDMSAPQAGYDLAGYCRSERRPGVQRGTPVPIGQFLDYADWYIGHLVPGVSDVTVTEIKAVSDGFVMSFADTESVVARSVVVATGLMGHTFVPAELSGLPSDLVSHTADHTEFDRFRGRRVAVVGAGSSALETAALLHEAGAEVTLVYRSPDSPLWGSRVPAQKPLTHNKLCEGWKCPFWNTPAAFRLLPQDMRVVKARTVLGPLGAWWLKDRVEGVVEMLGTTQVVDAKPSGSGVRLSILSPAGSSSREFDHVVAGTGYRVDVAHVGCLSADLLAQVATRAGYPVLTRNGESTVPGLYFAGALGAFGLGPSMRFIAGTHNLADRLASSVARRASANAERPAGPDSGDQSAQAGDGLAYQNTA